MTDIVTGGTLNTKMPKATMELFEEMTINRYYWHNSRAKSNKLAHVYDIDVVTTLVVQVKTLTKKIDGLAGTS